MKFKEMHQIKLKYQILAYGNYNEVIPTGEIVKFFVNEFADMNFIPNIFQELSFNTSNLGLKNETINRLALSSQDQNWLVRFNRDKIDISLTNGLLNQDFYSFEDFVKQVLEILEKVATKFPQKHNRVGFVTQVLTRDVDPKLVFDLFNKSIEYFEDERPVKWNNKFACRKLLDVGEGKNEVVNVNTDLGWVKGGIGQGTKTTEFEGFLMGIDINTQFENKTLRYDVSDIKSLVKNVVALEGTLRDQLESRVNN